jgi:hypothetical protein
MSYMGNDRTSPVVSAWEPWKKTGTHAAAHVLKVLLLAAALGAGAGRADDGTLSQDVYVWQRAWSEPVRTAVAERARAFDRIVVLGAEVSLRPKNPEIIRPAIDYAALRAAGRPIGLALRIGAYAGPFRGDDPTALLLGGLAASLVQDARSNGVRAAELQIDFDCAESKLEGYRIWAERLRREVAPTPLVLTVLPSWLNQSAFRRLAAASDGFVLQVHSFERPQRIDSVFTLCDPALARRAVGQAGHLGAPFRVALPTYGYVMAFDGDGRYLGISAEGPAKQWPPGTQFRTVRADPAALAGLVAGWQEASPPRLQGIIWYRLPVEGDRLNWRWPTLAAVMAGRAPRTELEAALRRPKPGLVEIDLRNRGEADIEGPAQVTLRWQGARVLACDGLLGFEAGDAGTEVLQFYARAFRLPPGVDRFIGWVRFDGEAQVRIERAEAGN